MTTPEDEPQTIPEIVERVPAMAAIAAELLEHKEEWAPGVHHHDLDVNTAALLAYQAMAKYPPKTWNELMLWVLGVLPDATIEEDLEGQLIVHTGLRASEDETSEALEKIL